MCGRYVVAYDPATLVHGFSLTRVVPFPKRWNVALTRAKQRLFIVGDLGAYRAEAGRARGEVMIGRAGRPGEQRPLMSVLARIVEAYDHQIAIAGGAR